MDTSLKFFKKHSSLFLLLFFGVIFTSLFASQFVLSAQEPWDFKTYYFATKTFFAGGNPYNIAEINKINNTEIKLPFLYHPYFLLLFSPFIKYSLENAAKIYMPFNFALIFYLLWLWHAIFEGKTKIFLLLFLLFFSFNQALSIVIRSGNIPLIEAAILWTAFYFLLKDKPFWFSVFILFGSMFKLLPILFLPLVLFFPSEKRKHIGKVVLCSIGLWFLPFLFRPHFLLAYIAELRNLPLEKAWINPCSYSIIVDALGRWGRSDVSYLPNLVYVVWVALILYFFWRALKRLEWKRDKQSIIFLSFLTFIISVPRFKDYSFVQAVPLAYNMIIKNIQLIFLPFLSLFGFIPRSNYYISNYHPFFAVLIFWAYLVYNILKRKIKG